MTVRLFITTGAMALMWLVATPTFAMQLVHSERSLYRQVLVYEEGGTRCLCFTKQCTIGRQSCILTAQPDKLVFEYTHMMLASLLMGPAPNSVLIIGLGGGSLPRALQTLLPSAKIDAVEIDPAVTRVARRYFGFKSGPNLQVFEEDGRTFVRRAVRSGKSYDLIMLDAYDHEYIPEHLLTREFLAEVRSLMRPNGVIAANTFSSSRLYNNESVTYQAVFGTFYNLKAGNRVILARRGPLPGKEDLQRNAAVYQSGFRALGFGADGLLSMFSIAPDWDKSARILTDQYSPANLLNSRN